MIMDNLPPLDTRFFLSTKSHNINISANKIVNILDEQEPSNNDKTNSPTKNNGLSSTPKTKNLMLREENMSAESDCDNRNIKDHQHTNTHMPISSTITSTLDNGNNNDDGSNNNGNGNNNGNLGCGHDTITVIPSAVARIHQQEINNKYSDNSSNNSDNSKNKSHNCNELSQVNLDDENKSSITYQFDSHLSYSYGNEKRNETPREGIQKGACDVILPEIHSSNKFLWDRSVTDSPSNTSQV